MNGPAGNSGFCFRSTSIFPESSPRATLSVSGKQKSLFPAGPVCLLSVVILYITVMIRFSALLPISAPPSPSNVFLLISAPILIYYYRATRGRIITRIHTAAKTHYKNSGLRLSFLTFLPIRVHNFFITVSVIDKYIPYLSFALNILLFLKKEISAQSQLSALPWGTKGK